MAETLGWLHISDIHFLDKTGWRDGRVLDTLVEDVAQQRKAGLAIDFVLCTGNIGFGQTGKESLEQQYASAEKFFTQLLQCCELKSECLFLVPGNHDTNREQAFDSLTEYFRSNKRSAAAINQLCQDQKPDWRNAMARLSQYQTFIGTHYKHIKLDANASFSSQFTVKGIKINICGLNSAWSCVDDFDKNQLWLAGQAQLAHHRARLEEHGGERADVRLGLIHHPLDWFYPEEQKELKGLLENDFDFLLHGHKHAAWVKPVPTPYHMLISAGASTAASEGEFGYNIVQLGAGGVRVHLRRYDARGGGWVADNIANRAADGIWSCALPAQLRSHFCPSATAETNSFPSGSIPNHAAPLVSSVGSELAATVIDPTTTATRSVQSTMSTQPATNQLQDSPLAIWQEKLNFLQIEEAQTSDASAKFAIKMGIKEAKEKIRKYGGQA